MSDINETQLPGIGVRHDFETREGSRIGIILHHSGRRDLLVYDQDDPDSCALSMPLHEDDARTLGELLGTPHMEDQKSVLQQSVGGLTIDWVPVGDKWLCIGNTISQIDLRALTGVTIIGIIRDQKMIPMPGPDFTLQIGDTAVVVGPPEGIRKSFDLMRGS